MGADLGEFPPGQQYALRRADPSGEVGFSAWTTDGCLRHPRHRGVRDDEDPADVVREQ